MKRAAALSLCLLALACSSGGNAKILQPDVQFVQLTGPAELGYPSGNMEVQYGMRITNKSSEEITLRQIQLESVGSGGAYTLRRETYYFRKVVPPSQTSDLTFWAKAYAYGNAYAIDALAPITVRGIATFESPAGAFRKVFVKNLNQMGRGAGN